MRKKHHYGLGEPVRSWGGSAVLGVPPMSDCRGLPHSRSGVVSPGDETLESGALLKNI
ncbi:MAG: hypothetical protein F6K55_46900 [Moorea sp. SIO4A3]|nr:hypothetical protein [Moorena sp. SIO4A3]